MHPRSRNFHRIHSTILPRVLIVEEDARVREFLRKTISQLGCSVTPVSTFREGFRLLCQKKFEIVLTDVSGGRGLSGLDFLNSARRLKNKAYFVLMDRTGAFSISKRLPRVEPRTLREPLREDKVLALMKRVVSKVREKVAA